MAFQCMVHLNVIQTQYSIIFNRCYKRCYISVPLNVKDVMHTKDKKLFSKARALSYHLLNEILPKPKPLQYTCNLRRMVCLCPKINTECFKNTFVKRLLFEHKLFYLHNSILAISIVISLHSSCLCNIGYVFCIYGLLKTSSSLTSLVHFNLQSTLSGGVGGVEMERVNYCTCNNYWHCLRGVLILLILEHHSTTFDESCT